MLEPSEGEPVVVPAKPSKPIPRKRKASMPVPVGSSTPKDQQSPPEELSPPAAAQLKVDVEEELQIKKEKRER